MEYDYRHPETPEEIKNVKANLSVATYEQKNLFAVLAGGGYQIQASFGNKNGYIATLDLDINSFVKVGVENPQRAKAIMNKKYEIAMNTNNFNDFFSDFKLNDFIVKVT